MLDKSIHGYLSFLFECKLSFLSLFFCIVWKDTHTPNKSFLTYDTRGKGHSGLVQKQKNAFSASGRFGGRKFFDLTILKLIKFVIYKNSFWEKNKYKF